MGVLVLKTENKVYFGVGILVFMSVLIAILEVVQTSKISGSTDATVKALVIVIIIACIMIAVIALFVGASQKNSIKSIAKRITSYLEKIKKGDTSFKVEDKESGVLKDVCKEVNEIINANKERAAVANAISNGDLTVESIVYSEKDTLGKAMRDMANKYNSILCEIKDSSYRLSEGAEQIASASQTLAQGTTEQASAIEQIAASMKDIHSMSRENADNSNKANSIVQSTKKGALLGNERMEEMKKAMDEIDEASEKISKIIKVIDDISFQTNILALNAAVEAARAGEHGKGFAVVAEQIRELAGRSAHAAAETAEMIEDSIRKVRNGTTLAEETAKALDEIMNDINSVADITGSINNASEEQALAVEQIDIAIEQVSQAIQNNSGASERCAATAEDLSSQAISLRSSICDYRLKGSGSKSYSSNAGDNVYRREKNKKNDSQTSPEDIISLDGDWGKY